MRHSARRLALKASIIALSVGLPDRLKSSSTAPSGADGWAGPRHSVCAVEAWHKRSQSSAVGPLLCGRLYRSYRGRSGSRPEAPVSPVHTCLLLLSLLLSWPIDGDLQPVGQGPAVLGADRPLHRAVRGDREHDGYRSVAVRPYVDLPADVAPRSQPPGLDHLSTRNCEGQVSHNLVAKALPRRLAEAKLEGEHRAPGRGIRARPRRWR